MKLKRSTVRYCLLVLIILLCLPALFACSATKPEPLTPEVVTVTKLVELPPQKAQAYQPCLVDENIPGFTDQLPAYVAGILTIVDECNRRNGLISEQNQKL